MSTLTYERMNSLGRHGRSSKSVLQELHDYIYQWTETIPTGGTRVDITEALKTIYQQHSEQLAIEKARAAQTKEIESIDSDLHGNDSNYDDAEYDRENQAQSDY
jgi:hypothetical protein